jgi:hypothetical protein
MTTQTRVWMKLHRQPLSPFAQWKRRTQLAQRPEPPKQEGPSQQAPRRLPLPGYGLTVWEG